MASGYFRTGTHSGEPRGNSSCVQLTCHYVAMDGERLTTNNRHWGVPQLSGMQTKSALPCTRLATGTCLMRWVSLDGWPLCLRADGRVRAFQLATRLLVLRPLKNRWEVGVRGSRP